MRIGRIGTAEQKQRRFAVRVQREKGVALITALLILMLVSAIVPVVKPLPSWRMAPLPMVVAPV